MEFSEFHMSLHRKPTFQESVKFHWDMQLRTSILNPQRLEIYDNHIIRNFDFKNNINII